MRKPTLKKHHPVTRLFMRAFFACFRTSSLAMVEVVASFAAASAILAESVTQEGIILPLNGLHRPVSWIIEGFNLQSLDPAPGDLTKEHTAKPAICDSFVYCCIPFFQKPTLCAKERPT